MERNRVKRVLREEFARISDGLQVDVDYVVIARPGVYEYVEERGSRALGERLEELVAKVMKAAA